MNKKTIPVLAAVLLLLSLFGNPADAVYAAEDTFEVESTWLPATVAFEPYTARIPMKNGNEGYTFRLVSGYVPAGLNISNKNAAFTQEGIITGRAQGSGRHTLNIEIKNERGEKKRITFYIHISPIKVRVKVAAPTDIVYDGKPHYADVQCYNYDDEAYETPLDGVRANVSYGGETAAVAAGTYPILVTAPTGMLLQEVSGDKYMTIRRAAVEAFSIEGVTAGYDGDPHPAKVTIQPEDVPYAVEYRKEDETEFTSEPPVEPGRYTARAHITDVNYNRVTVQGSIFISAGMINFDVSENVHTYDSAAHRAVVRPTREDLNWQEGTDYIVHYTDANGREAAEPTDAGEYAISVELLNSEYSVGVIGGTLQIQAREVAFAVSENEAVYDGEPKKATLAAQDYAGAYAVRYRSRKTGEESESPATAGVYEIVISIDNSNYAVVQPEEDLIIRPHIYLTKGNSPAALEVSVDFSGFIADEIDLDALETTYITKDINEFYQNDALQMIVEDGYDTQKVVSEQTQIDGSDKNLYRVTYSYTDTNTDEMMQLVRYVMVVNQIGDGNGDGYVNMLDANVLRKFAAAQVQTVEQARVMDVTKDGKIDEDDVNAIRKRYSIPLVPYYPWIAQ